MANALWITVIGMSLVFASIMLLWGMMVLLVRLSDDRTVPPAPQPKEGSSMEAVQESTAIPEGALLLERKRKAAAAAVAAALALQQSHSGLRVEEPSTAMSAWQVVHRAGQINQQSYAPRKKGNR
jgi:Na+-transporting methylmalonyl-CoA/oxaloacetate decarboxylase gamma subunit